MKSIFCTLIILFNIIFATSFCSNPSEKMDRKKTQKATLGGGCFWCVEAIFNSLEGVIEVQSGYSGGSKESSNYKVVCSGKTNHAEVVQITYNKVIIPFERLLEVFFQIHDPTTLNRQGADVGSQYRSVVFYHNEEQKKAVTELIKELNAVKVYPSPIVTEVAPFKKFYKAENYHQDYYNNNKYNPYCRVVIQPKLAKFKKTFEEYLKE